MEFGQVIKYFYVYIMTNQRNTVLYTGITSDLKARVYQHKTKAVRSFTSRYNVNKLVWYVQCEDPLVAIGLEKKLKGSSRAKKIALIESMNPDWRDLYESL